MIMNEKQTNNNHSIDKISQIINRHHHSLSMFINGKNYTKKQALRLDDYPIHLIKQQKINSHITPYQALKIKEQSLKQSKRNKIKIKYQKFQNQMKNNLILGKKISQNSFKNSLIEQKQRTKIQKIKIELSNSNGEKQQFKQNQQKRNSNNNSNNINNKQVQFQNSKHFPTIDVINPSYMKINHLINHYENDNSLFYIPKQDHQHQNKSVLEYKKIHSILKNRKQKIPQRKGSNYTYLYPEKIQIKHKSKSIANKNQKKINILANKCILLNQQKDQFVKKIKKSLNIEIRHRKLSTLPSTTATFDSGINQKKIENLYNTLHLKQIDIPNRCQTMCQIDKKKLSISKIVIKNKDKNLLDTQKKNQHPQQETFDHLLPWNIEEEILIDL